MSENQKLREALQAISHIDDTTSHTADASVALDHIGQIARQALALPTEPAHADTWGISRAMVTLYAYECDGLTGEALALPTAKQVDDINVAESFTSGTKTAAPVGEHEVFEREMMDKYGWQHEDFKLDDFGYADGQTDTAWMAWQARASLSAGDAGWQPIETAPMDGRLGLVYRPLAANTRDEPIAIKSLIGGDRFCWPNTAPKGSAPTNPTDGACHVTHWMPLPPAPATRKDKP